MRRLDEANQNTKGEWIHGAEGENILYDLFLWVHIKKHKSEELLPIMICVYLFLLLTRSSPHSFSLVSHPLPSSPLSLSRGIACLPRGWLKELVRLSSQGFYLVILPLGIHTTVLPPTPLRLPAWIPAHWRRLSPVISTLTFSCLLLCSHFPMFSPPCLLFFTCFGLILFYVGFLPLSSLCLPNSSLFSFFLESWIVCAFLNHVRAAAGSCNECWDGHRAGLRRAADLVEVTGSLSQQHAAAT